MFNQKGQKPWFGEMIEMFPQNLKSFSIQTNHFAALGFATSMLNPMNSPLHRIPWKVLWFLRVSEVANAMAVQRAMECLGCCVIH